MSGKASVQSPAVLKKPDGAQKIGYNATNVARVISDLERAREVGNLFSIAFNAASLADTCVMEKLRDDYPEFAAYRPISADGRFWARHLFTNRLNDDPEGATRVINISLAGLFLSSEVARVTENKSTGVTAVAATVTRTNAHVGAVVGVWSGSATTNGVTDVSWADAAGESKTLTITGANRILLRGLSAGNGGIGYARVYEDAAKTIEISESLYLSPSDRKVNFNTSNGLILVPVADGLDDTHEYTVEVGVHADNTPGNRVYFAGLLGYPGIEYDDVGVHGIVDDAELPTGENINSRSYYSGTREVYFFDDVTRIDWRYVSTNSGGITQFQAFTSAGVPVPLMNSSVDGYSSGSIAKKVTLFKRQAKGGFYVHVITGKTKNASSSDYRHYSYGLIGYDETVPGVLGVDEFDDNDVPKNVQDPNNGVTHMLVGSGNLELAIKVRKSTDDVGDAAFVGGIHCFESTPDPDFYADGVLLDWSAAPVGTKWSASEFVVRFDTVLDFPSDSSEFADQHYDLVITKSGYAMRTKTETLEDSYIHDFFSMMLNTPTTVAGNQGENVGGGFKHLIADQNYLATDFVDGSELIDSRLDGWVLVNKEFAVGVKFTSREISGIENNYESISALIDNRSTAFRDVKVYCRLFNCDRANGVFVPAGTVFEVTKIISVAMGNFESLFGVVDV